MNAFWFSLFFPSESFWRRCISFTATSFHEWSLFFSFSNVDVCIRRLIMLATYFSSLHKLFNLALLFRHDKSTSLAIISESALLQFMQFIVVYSSSRFILLWLYCSFQKFALRALWLFSYSNMLRSFLNLKVMMITTEFTKKMNNEERLIIQDLCNDLSYYCKRLRIQFYINWRTENDEWEWNDNIMLLNLILKLLHYAKDLNWIFSHTLNELFNSMLIINWEIVRWLHLSERITKWDFNIWKCCRKCKSFIMSETELN